MRNFKDRDFLLVHPDVSFRKPEHYVVARSPDSEFVAKLLRRVAGAFVLEPETEGYLPIPIDDPDWRIVGPVVGHRRESRITTKLGGMRVRSYFEIGDNLGLTPDHYA